MLKRKRSISVTILFLIIVCLIVYVILKQNSKTVEINLKDDQHIGNLIKYGSVLCVDSNICIINGVRKKISDDNGIRPFIQDGITYIPIEEVSKWFNAKVEQDKKNSIVNVNSKGYTSEFIPKYNVIIFNKEALIMRSDPVVKNERIYLPANYLAKILNISFYQDYDEGLVMFGAAKKPTAEEFQLIKKAMGLKIHGSYKCADLDRVNSKVKIFELYDISREGRLYITDDKGVIFKWTLLDDFKLLKEEINVNFEYAKNSVFIANYKTKNNMLYHVDTDEIKEYSLLPEQIAKNDVTYASRRYFETRIITDIFQDNIQQKYRDIYTKAMSGEIKNTDFLAEKSKKYRYQYGDSNPELLELKKKLNCTGSLVIPLTTKFDLFTFEKVCEFQKANGLAVVGYIDEDTYNKIATISIIDTKNVNIKAFLEKEWLDICDNARPGDILLFRNNAAQDKYGYNTHAALILDVSKDKGEIHVLHARSEELGVGADKPMDRISFDSLFSNNYWLDENQIMLYTVPTVNDEVGQKISDSAYVKFKDYQFGYGGSQGSKETTCVEIVRDAFKTQNIDVLNKTDYSLSIKKVLDKDIRNLLLVPDDLMLCNMLKLKCIWERLDS